MKRFISVCKLIFLRLTLLLLLNMMFVDSFILNLKSLGQKSIFHYFIVNCIIFCLTLFILYFIYSKNTNYFKNKKTFNRIKKFSIFIKEYREKLFSMLCLIFMDDTLLDFIKNFFDQLGISDILNLEIFNGIKDEFLKLIVNPLSNLIVSHILKTKDYQTNLNAYFSVLIVNLYIYYGYKIYKSIKSKNKREIKMTNQLIIIGNGFDLACGLKSSYKDFFEWKFKNQTKGVQYNGTFEKHTPVRSILDKIIPYENFWLAIFYSNIVRVGRFEIKIDTNNWADIEQILKHYLVFIKDNFDNNLVEKNCSREQLPFSEVIQLSAIDVIYFAQQRISNCKITTKDELFSLLLSDLRLLEKIFSVYLKKQVLDNEYSKNAEDLLSKLLGDKRISDTQVLSFNYTNMFKSNINLINVHGELDKDIVFGIDSFDLSSKEYQQMIKFSKTYRLMSLKRENLNISPDTDIIKFYGHSLGEADYSYFQSIFDIVNLYSGTTKLIFYFSKYGGKTLEEVEEEIFERVWLLIQKYGETLDNKDHGKNLIHKLQLENRLVIKELKF